MKSRNALHHGKTRLAVLAVVSLVSGWGRAPAQEVGEVLYQEDFTSPSISGFAVNGGEDTVAALNFDFSPDSVYGGAAIPPAPHTTDGSKLALRLEANMNPPGNPTSISVFPAPVFSGDFRATVDVFMRVNGPPPSGGTGCTQYYIVGINHTGERRINHLQAGTADEPVATDGYYFTADGDGGATADYAFLEGDPLSVDSLCGYWMDGSGGCTVNATANSFFQSIYPSSTSNYPGCSGDQWTTVRFDYLNGQISVYLNDTLVHIYFAAGRPWTEGRVCLGMEDPFASLAPPGTSFVLFDNLKVERLIPPTPTPTPTPRPTPEEPPLLTYDLLSTETTGIARVYGPAPISTLSQPTFGDFDGDGYDDLMAVNLGFYGLSGRNGAAYVVYGGPSLPDSVTDLASPGPDPKVTRILGDNSDEFSVQSIVSADVNGDGLDDLILGCDNSVSGDWVGELPATGYIVFGRSARPDGDIDLAGDPAAEGVARLVAGEPEMNFGLAMSAGDVNGDGIGDVLIPSVWRPSGTTLVGQLHLVYGGGWLSARTYTLSGPSVGDPVPQTLIQSDSSIAVGAVLSTCGDVDGDGIDDVIYVELTQTPGNTGGAPNLTWIIYGRGDTPLGLTLSRQALDDGLTRITRSQNPDQPFGTYPAAGDLNGDGYDDLWLGCLFSTVAGRPESGFAYLLPGASNLRGVEIDLDSETEVAQYRIGRVDGDDGDSLALAAFGDVTQDGAEDLIVGAFGAPRDGVGTSVGETIVFTRSDEVIGQIADLRRTRGQIRVLGDEAGASFGLFPRAGGDLNEDGRGDFSAAAYFEDNPARGSEGDNVGMTLTVFGVDRPSSTTALLRQGPGAAALRAFGGPLSPVERCWIAFADGETTGAALSAETVVRIIRSKDGLTSFTARPLDEVADVVWELTTTRVNWTGTTVAFECIPEEIEGLDRARLNVYRSDSLEGPYAALETRWDGRRVRYIADTDRLGFFAIAQSDTPPATPTPSPTPSPTPTPSPSLTPSPTPSPSPSPSPTASPTPTPSPTESPVPTATPSLTPSPTPTPSPRIEFTFEGGPEGWWHGMTPPFHEAQGFAGDGGLTLFANDNTYTFGFWESPLFEIAGSEPAALSWGLAPLYRAVFLVTGPTGDPQRAPTLQLRTSADTFEQTDALVVESRGDAAFSPGNDGRPYIHYFSPPPSRSRLRLDFDLLNFDPDDTAATSVTLEYVVVERLEPLGTPRSEITYDFTQPGGAEGWTFRTAETAFTPPHHEITEQGLLLRGESPTSPALATGDLTVADSCFGYWSSPEGEADPGVALEANRLYRATFTVTSGASEAERNRVPTFRLRLNEAGFRAAAYVNVESISGLSRVPVAGQPVTYDVYLTVPPELAGSRLLFALDYVHPAGSTNDPSISVALQKLEVVSFAFFVPF